MGGVGDFILLTLVLNSGRNYIYWTKGPLNVDKTHDPINNHFSCNIKSTGLCTHNNFIYLITNKSQFSPTTEEAKRDEINKRMFLLGKFYSGNESVAVHSTAKWCWTLKFPCLNCSYLWNWQFSFQLKGPGSFWVFNAQICILPHSRDSFSLIFDIYINTKSW